MTPLLPLPTSKDWSALTSPLTQPCDSCSTFGIILALNCTCAPTPRQETVYQVVTISNLVNTSGIRRELITVHGERSQVSERYRTVISSEEVNKSRLMHRVSFLRPETFQRIHDCWHCWLVWNIQTYKLINNGHTPHTVSLSEIKQCNEWYSAHCSASFLKKSSLSLQSQHSANSWITNIKISCVATLVCCEYRSHEGRRL